VKKNRTLIIVILLCIGGSIWALLPTWQTSQNRKTLESLKDSSARAKWLAANEEDMKNTSAKSIKLGLDLRGGIYVTMEVDVLKYIEDQATGKDAVFAKVIAATQDEERTSDEPVVDMFARKFKEIATPSGKNLLNYFIFNDSRVIEEKDVVAQLKGGTDEAVDRAIEIIRNRIDQFGLTEPTIQKFGTRRIIIEVPGVADPTQVRQLLEGTAQLEFRLLKDPKIVSKIIDRIDKHLAGIAQTPADTAKKADTTAMASKADTAKAAKPIAKKEEAAKKGKPVAAKADSAMKKDSAAMAQKLSPEDSVKRADSLSYAGLTQEQKVAKFTKEHPFTAIIGKYMNQQNGRIFVPELDRKTINEIMLRPDVKAIYEGELSLEFGKPEKGTNGQNFYEIHFLNATSELTGKYITDASAEMRDGKPKVTMQMDEEGARIWSRVTGANVGKQIAIVLDNVVYSAPTVQNRIDGGNSEITGSKDIQEANLLKIVLKAGALPAPVKIIQEQVVGPSLGEDSINKGTQSIIYAFLAVILFMALYYVAGGFVADLAVIINLLFTLAVLATFGATLTLPGMAGLVLTVGIAVDANVLIYERIREELSSGKSLKLAIDDGYKRAFAPIFDGHLTAFFSGLILYSFGTGTVQGFAVTLMIGIAASLFTAIVITRVIFDVLLERAPNIVKFG
jgi:preprotein translocase subunit SecD